MGDIGPVRGRYEVLPIGRELESVEPVVAGDSASPPARPFPSGRRENWLRRTVRTAR